MYLGIYFLLASVTEKLNLKKESDYEFFFMSKIHTETDN